MNRREAIVTGMGRDHGNSCSRVHSTRFAVKTSGIFGFRRAVSSLSTEKGKNVYLIDKNFPGCPQDRF